MFCVPKPILFRCERAWATVPKLFAPAPRPRPRPGLHWRSIQMRLGRNHRQLIKRDIGYLSQ